MLRENDGGELWGNVGKQAQRNHLILRLLTICKCVDADLSKVFGKRAFRSACYIMYT